MPTQKRERKRQGHQARQAAIAAARKRQQSRTRAIAGGFLAVVLIAGVAVLVSPGDDDQEVASTAPTTTVEGATTTAVAKKPVELPPVPAGASIKGDTPCPPADGSAPRTTSFEKPPPMCVVVAKTYTAEIQTTKGLMVASLDVKNATKTVNNFVVLARYKYFDGIAFHRIIPGFVLQGGDPQQTGTGGPGYKFEDELPKTGSYKVGSLAMANSGPNTNGSQFFVIAGDTGTSLQPQYSLFGQVTQGLEVVKAIEDVGIPGNADGKPSEVVKITSVTIKET
ncbi:MAG: Peptidyl-prolyl cis-trans isomerase [uncultured Acidimicrobiales bacterium]|uniref:Peptidyl-prolyl cis-trans isomerase n=1 Tax=uncultured Acidimicrobiales bacterium TaxID=310071 RepID=A0A6J4IBS0_9ACTN|nr:MAG: Peptidyl-prolyl cis-trans isomerase [uncultured Acidimicrobiales bacterium]